MANTKVTLNGPFNNVSLVLGNNYNIVSPGSGHYYFLIMNVGTANVAVSNASTVGLADPSSFLLPPNMSISPLAKGTDGVWLAAGAAESVSVQLIPRQ